jgi:hypothetical protein
MKERGGIFFFGTVSIMRRPRNPFYIAALHANKLRFPIRRRVSPPPISAAATGACPPSTGGGALNAGEARPHPQRLGIAGESRPSSTPRNHRGIEAALNAGESPRNRGRPPCRGSTAESRPPSTPWKRWGSEAVLHARRPTTPARYSKTSLLVAALSSGSGP